MWQRELVKQTHKGSRTYSYWMACWREGSKTRNVHLGSSKKMDAKVAGRKARGRRRKRWVTVEQKIDDRS